MERQSVWFSDDGLRAMIIPLFLEQLLVMLVGLADTLVELCRGSGQSALVFFDDVLCADCGGGAHRK